MSEWIDFAVYVTLIVLIFVLLPRNSRRFTLPAIADRNPEWIVSHRDVAARLERSRWFLDACYLWAAASIAVLAGVALDLIPPFGAAAPKWEVLKDLTSTFVIVGALGWAVGTVLWLRWLGRYVPLAETRRATLKPRVVGDYLSWPWRLAVEVLTMVHLGAWVVTGALGLAGGVRYWSGFALIVSMTVLFAVWAALAPRRRPGLADRLFGEEYRRIELRIAYMLRLTPLIPGGVLIAEQALGLDADRVGHLLIVLVVNVMALICLRLRPVAQRPPRLDAGSRLSA
jgi:hypothetical protein